MKIITLEQLQAILAKAYSDAGIAPSARTPSSNEEAYAAIREINNQAVFDQLLALLDKLEQEGSVTIDDQPISVQEKDELSANKVELKEVKGLVEDVVSQKNSSNPTATATAGGVDEVDLLGLEELLNSSVTSKAQSQREHGSSMPATEFLQNSGDLLDVLVKEDSKTANPIATIDGEDEEDSLGDRSTIKTTGPLNVNHFTANPMNRNPIGFTKEAISAQNAKKYKAKIEFINKLRRVLSDPRRNEWFRISNYSTYREYGNISQKLLEGAKELGTNPRSTQKNTVELYAEDKYRGGISTVEGTRTEPVKVILSREDNHIMASYADETVAIAEIKKNIDGSLVIQDIKPDNVLNLGWNGLLAKLFVNEDSSRVSRAFTALVLVMASPLIAVAAILVALKFASDKSGLTNNVLAPTWNFLKDSVWPCVEFSLYWLGLIALGCAGLALGLALGGAGLALGLALVGVGLGLYIAAVVYNKIVAPLLAHILINVYDIASQISLLVYNFVTNPVFLGISTSVALAVIAFLVLASNPIVLAFAAVIFMSVMIFVGLDSKLGARQNRTNEKLDYAIELLKKNLGDDSVDISAEEKWTTAAENAKNTSGKMLENIKNIFNSIFKLLGLTSLYNVLFNKQEHTQNRALNPTESTFKGFEKGLNPLGHKDYGYGLNSWFADGSYDLLDNGDHDISDGNSDSGREWARRDSMDCTTPNHGSIVNPLHEADHDSSSTQAAAGKSWFGGLFGSKQAANDDASSNHQGKHHDITELKI